MAKFLPFIFAVLILLILPSWAYAQNLHPQITFGDLLETGQGQPLRKPSEQSKASSKSELVKKFLAKLEENGNKSLDDFYGTRPTPSKSSLSDNVAGYFLTPVPTLNPKLETILAQANNLKITVSPPPSYIGQGDVKPSKSSYTIALLGDSMTDTLGENLPHLNRLLKEAYPKTNFVLLNYGQGATNIESGLHRLTNPTKYLNRDYPPLLHLTPDILIIESFAYNHWGSNVNDLNRQWLTAVKIMDTVKNYSKETKMVMLATISPNPEIFGDGILNWPKNLKWDSSITTKAYLQNFIGLAHSSGLPLADAYTPSLTSTGFGDPKYINSADHLHPSEAGKALIAQKIVETIKNHQLIK